MFVQSISFYLKVGDTSANSHGAAMRVGAGWPLCPASNGSIEAVTG